MTKVTVATATDGGATEVAGDGPQRSTAERIAHREHSAFALSMMPFGVLLNEAESAMKVGELAMDGPLRDETLAVLSRMHHALFCRRVDGVDEAARRDAFHERLHALRQRVSEAKQAEEAARSERLEVAPAHTFTAEEARRHVANGAPAPQPMGGAVDAAIAQVRIELCPLVYDLQQRVKTLEALQRGNLQMTMQRDASVGERLAELERVAEMYQRKLDALEALGLPRIAADAEGFSGELSYMRECGGVTEERLAALEAQHEGDASPLARITALEARVNKLTNAAVMSAVGDQAQRLAWLDERMKDAVHITSEAEMVEAFGEGRGQAMWAECEARKSGGAK